MVTSRAEIAAFLNETFFTNTSQSITGDQVNDGMTRLLDSMWHKNDLIPNFVSEDLSGTEDRQHTFFGAQLALVCRDSVENNEQSQLLQFPNVIGFQASSYGIGGSVFLSGYEEKLHIVVPKISTPYISVYGKTGENVETTVGTASAELDNINLNSESQLNYVMTIESNIHAWGVATPGTDPKVISFKVRTVFFVDTTSPTPELIVIKGTSTIVNGDSELLGATAEHSALYGRTVTIGVNGVAGYTLSWTHTSTIYKH